MKKPGSFVNRLTLKVLRTVLLLMLVTLSVTFIVAYWALRGETVGRYLGMRGVVKEKISLEIKTIEIGARNVADDVAAHLGSPEAVMAALEKEIHLNNFADGYFAAFEPDYFPKAGKWFEAYAYKQSNGTYNIEQVGSAQHDYLNTEWYQRARQQKEGFWTDPYVYNDGVYCSFVLPVSDEEGRVVGVCGADLLLKNLINDLHNIDQDSRSGGMKNIAERYRHLDFYSFIINRSGTYIAHPDEKRVLKDSMMAHVTDNFYSDCKRTVRDMLQMKSGIDPVVVDGKWTDVYYTPIASPGWSLAIVVPKRALVTPMIVLLLNLLVVTGLGQILVWIICRWNIRKATNPLVALTHSADEVAKGNFEAPLPDLEYQDEICNLRDSFATMQQSLVKYIQDLETTTAKKAAMENEMNTARRIQMSMIPLTSPPSPLTSHLDMYGSLTPAKTVGGDLFDYFIRDERLYFCIGDVSGKGVPAALMMTVVHYLFRSATANVDEPERIVEVINDCFSVGNKTMMFCTFFLGVLDLKTGLLQFCNAGHEAPFMIGGTDESGHEGEKEVRRLKIEPNTAIGVKGGLAFTAEEIQLKPGTLLFMYTDGLTDATNGSGKRFELERVTAVLQQTAGNQGDRFMIDGSSRNQATCPLDSPAAYVRRMTDEVAAYVGDAPQADDLTMLVIKWKG